MKEQLGFAEDEPWWKEYWKDMPEFDQSAAPPFATVDVHFATAAAREDFARIIEQPISEKAHYIWHPRAVWARLRDWRYVDDPAALPK